MPDPLPILYQDDDLVVIHKPAGLLVHPSPIDRREKASVVVQLPEQLGRPVFSVHRLDKPTSGALVLALNRPAAQNLSYQFECGQVGKLYQAVVRGWPALGGIIRHPLSFIDDSRSRTRDPSRSQEATTLWHCLRRWELPLTVDGRHPTSRYALLKLAPKTGRRHQLRRHMKHISHPIVGDSSYGKGIHNRFFARYFDCPRLLLASTRLRLDHPVTGQPLTVDCPIADDFDRLLASLDGLAEGSLNDDCFDNPLLPE